MKKSNLFQTIRLGYGSLGTAWIYWLVYMIFVVYGLMLLSIDSTWKLIGIFDLVSNPTSVLVGGTNALTFIVLGIPFIVTVLHHFTEYQEQNIVTLKLGSRFRIWQIHALSATILSLLFTLILVIVSYLIGGLLVGFENTWVNTDGVISQILSDQQIFNSILPHVQTYEVLAVIFFTKFLAFLQISYLFFLLRIWIKNPAFIAILLIALTAINIFIFYSIYIIVTPGTLTVLDWVNPSAILLKWLYMFITSLIFYGVTGLLYEKRDFIK